MCGVMWLHACMRRPGCKLIFCGVASKTNNVPVVRHKVPMDPVTIRIEVISSKTISAERTVPAVPPLAVGIDEHKTSLQGAIREA